MNILTTNRDKILYFFSMISLFFLLSTRYKLQYEEAVRPFYTIGLILAFFIFITRLVTKSHIRNIFTSIVIQPQVLLLFGLMFYFFSSSVFISSIESGRQIKDILYFLYWVTIIPFLPLLLIDEKTSLDYCIRSLSKVVVFFAIFSLIFALIIFFNLMPITIAGIEFSQSVYLELRIHGLFGESTALAALLGLSMICIYFLSSFNQKNYFYIYVIIFTSILATGSRNALVSLFFVFFVGLALERLELKKIKLAIIIFFTVMPLILFLLYLTGFLDLVYLILFDRPTLDLNNELSRIYIWITTIDLLINSTPIEILFGHGSYELRSDLRAGFNSILEITYDYGILMGSVYVLIFVLSFFEGLRKYKKTKNKFYKIGILFITYGFSFSMFMSYFPTTFFNFSIFAFVLGIFMTSIPRKFVRVGY